MSFVVTAVALLISGAPVAGATPGTISTVAGNGTTGYAGDGGVRPLRL